MTNNTVDPKGKRVLDVVQEALQGLYTGYRSRANSCNRKINLVPDCMTKANLAVVGSQWEARAEAVQSMATALGMTLEEAASGE